jgi:hypothetical protein
LKAVGIEYTSRLIGLIAAILRLKPCRDLDGPGSHTLYLMVATLFRSFLIAVSKEQQLISALAVVIARKIVISGRRYRFAGSVTAEETANSCGNT